MTEFRFPREVVCPDDIKFQKNFDAQLEAFQPYYRMKFEICEWLEPRRIAEIGVRAGYSAWSFLQAVPNSEYFGFDLNQGTHGAAGGENGVYMKWARKILEGYRGTLTELDSQAVEDIGLTDIDLFHVDGDHSYDATFHDLDLALKAVRPEGFILIDDTANKSIPSVKQAVTDWLKEKMFDATWQEGSGIGQCLIRVKESNR